MRWILLGTLKNYLSPLNVEQISFSSKVPFFAFFTQQVFRAGLIPLYISRYSGVALAHLDYRAEQP